MGVDRKQVAVEVSAELGKQRIREALVREDRGVVEASPVVRAVVHPSVVENPTPFLVPASYLSEVLRRQDSPILQVPDEDRSPDQCMRTRDRQPAAEEVGAHGSEVADEGLVSSVVEAELYRWF